MTTQNRPIINQVKPPVVNSLATGSRTKAILERNFAMGDKIYTGMTKNNAANFDPLEWSLFLGDALRAQLKLLIAEGTEDVYAICKEVLGYELSIDPVYERIHGRKMPGSLSDTPVTDSKLQA